ncbi:MAG TPA: fluoride efflux transporter CrcB [Steroidobacteraceae bacterium]|nr:fluoride efflux transporter CrcB [Steroidobacteraceae bacterium]
MWGWKTIVAVSLGASLGALLRLGLSESLNASFPPIPPGTLLSNLIGGYVVGVAIAFFATSSLPIEWRLFLITGFCGGLTTFSTFSAELVIQLQQGRPLWAVAAALTHLVGSVAMTFAGVGTVFLAKRLAS